MIQLASIYCFYIPNLTDGHGPRDILCMPLFLDMMFRYDAGNPVNGNRPTVNLHHIKTAQVFSIYLVIDIPYRVVGMHRIIAEVCCRDHPRLEDYGDSYRMSTRMISDDMFLLHDISSFSLKRYWDLDIFLNADPF